MASIPNHGGGGGGGKAAKAGGGGAAAMRQLLKDAHQRVESRDRVAHISTFR